MESCSPRLSIRVRATVHGWIFIGAGTKRVLAKRSLCEYAKSCLVNRLWVPITVRPTIGYDFSKIGGGCTGFTVNGIYRTLSQTGEGEGFAAVGRSPLRWSWSDRPAANRSNRRRPFEYNLRPFPPTLQNRFGSHFLSDRANEGAAGVGVDR